MNPEQPQYNPEQQPTQPQPVVSAQPVVTQPSPQPQQFAQPAPAQTSNPELFAKKVKNAGKSVFALGIFIAAMTTLAGIATIADISKGEGSASQLGVAFVSLAILLAGAIVMIAQGHKLKQAANLQAAQRAINVSLIANGAILAANLLLGSKLTIIGLLVIITIIYLFVAKSGIKKVA